MIEIIPVNYGKSVLPESMVFENGSEGKYRPILFRIFLLKNAELRLYGFFATANTRFESGMSASL